jgi:thiamine biosynthesis lipoprotein
MTSAADVSFLPSTPLRLAGWWLGISLLLAGCSVSEPNRQATFSGIAFFSISWQVRVSNLPANVNSQQLQAELQNALDEVNTVLSTYQSDTELMRFNAGPIEQCLPVSEMLGDTVASALLLSEKTQGRYDITVGPLVNLWGFGPEARPEKTPTAAEIARARKYVGWQGLAVNSAKRCITKHKALALDASSLGEGVGVRALAAVLARHGIEQYLISVAGVSQARGRRADGLPWRVAIESADGSGRPALAVALDNAVISTSGSYRNYYELDGVRYSHTIDPLTAYPITHKGVSVTVVSKTLDAVLADAWATALNVLGPEEGLSLAEKEGLAAYFIEKTTDGFTTHQTSKLAQYLPTE